MSTSTTTTTRDKALKLLGANVPAVHVAAALGVTESTISQYMAQEDFASEVSQLKFTTLQAHSTRDLAYDEIEDTLLTALKDTVPLLMRPMEIAKVLTAVNQAKRRGAANPESNAGAVSKVVSITMPTKIIQNFTTNIYNQVVKAGSQDLVTMPSGVLSQRMKEVKELSHAPTEAIVEQVVTPRNDSRLTEKAATRLE